LLLAGAGSKPVPVIVILAPGAASVGEKLLIVGAGTPGVTVNGLAELTVLPPLVTEISPELAPAGTLTTNWVPVAEITVAEVPLNVTVFALGVDENPDP
jgi:hypothetical protein